MCVGGWGMALSRLRYWDLLTLIHIMYVYNQVDWTKWSFWLMVKWKLCFQSLPHPSFSSSIALVAYYAVSYLYPWMHSDLYYIIDMLWYKMKKYEYSFIHSLNNEFIFNKWNALMCYNNSLSLFYKCIQNRIDDDQFCSCWHWFSKPYFRIQIHYTSIFLLGFNFKIMFEWTRKN